MKQLRLTDYHCHILPQIDDGSKSVEMSLEMISIMRNQGVEKIIATPHFYAHCEESVASYLDKRQKALDKLIEADSSCSEIILGAEVAIEHGISKLDGIEKLVYTDTNMILLEFPYRPFEKWMIEEVEEISAAYGLTPIIAHVHRCLPYTSKENMNRILQLNAIFQINNEAFENFKERRFVKSLINEGYPYIFGSDAHNLTSRKPNWDMLTNKVKPEVIGNAEVIV